MSTVFGAHPAAATPIVVENNQTVYHWHAADASDSAQLLTLSCSHCGPLHEDVPLIAVLRDRLAAVDSDTSKDRITDLWMLSYSPPSLHGRLLSAVPFFYWRFGQGSTKVPRTIKPFIDLTAPEHPVVSGVAHDLVQTVMLDPSMMPIRASSRAYRSNELDRERLHLEQAISYLQRAPTGENADQLTNSECEFLIARLTLRKRLLGGLVGDRDASHIGEQVEFEQERVRSRNWELLRQCAEKTGLLFEPLNLAGTSGEYAVLWFSPDSQRPPGIDLTPMWKLLSVGDPWRDARLNAWNGITETRTAGDGLARRMVPLGVYSLDYPAMPLLLVDFRNNLHVRKHEMTQRSVNELVNGFIGISHFANWYYYAGAYLYNFVVSRHGTAMNQAERLDCYSRLRTALALDRSLDPEFRAEIARRINALSVNPSDSSPSHEVELAQARSRVLDRQAEDGELARRVDLDRRAELAGYGVSPFSEVVHDLLHNATFGLYTKRVKPEAENLEALKRVRQATADIALLDRLGSTGQPEILYDPARIQGSVRELAASLPYLTEAGLRTHAHQTLIRLQAATADSGVKEQCELALNQLTAPGRIDIATSIRATTTR